MPTGRIRIDITDAQSAVAVPAALVRRVVRAVLAAEGRRSAEISIAFVDDPAIAEVHGEFFDDPTPTDIVTFDLGDEGSGVLSGELIISGDHAAREAAERGTDAPRELLLYVVHGLLHLCGWDDRTPADFRAMHAREDEILSSLGLGPVFGPAGSGPSAKPSPRRGRTGRKV
jgi:probable rRNA maturation factor